MLGRWGEGRWRVFFAIFRISPFRLVVGFFNLRSSWIFRSFSVCVGNRDPGIGVFGESRYVVFTIFGFAWEFL